MRAATIFISLLAMAAAHAAPLLAQEGAQSAASADDLATIKERGVLRVGVAELTPWAIHTGLGDNVIGYEIDSTAKLAEHLGVKRELVEVPFGELAYALRDGRFDIIASGYSMSDDRRRIIDFSLPYNQTAYKLVISKEAAKDGSAVKDFNKKSLEIGYLLGGLSEDVAKQNFGKAMLTPFEYRADALRALMDGEIDGFVGSDPFYTAVVLAQPDRFSIPIETPLFLSIEAFGVRKNQDALLDELNAWVVAQEQAGLFKTLHAKWFNDMLWLSVFKEMTPVADNAGDETDDEKTDTETPEE